jgi:hypothetical protein
LPHTDPRVPRRLLERLPSCRRCRSSRP